MSFHPELTNLSSGHGWFFFFFPPLLSWFDPITSILSGEELQKQGGSHWECLCTPSQEVFTSRVLQKVRGPGPDTFSLRGRFRYRHCWCLVATKSLGSSACLMWKKIEIIIIKKKKKTLSYCCTRWNLQRAWFMLVYSLHVMTFKGCIHEIYIYNNTLIAPTLEREREWK